MKYYDYNDYELLSYVEENNETANEILLKKYDPIILSLARKYYNDDFVKKSGIDMNDMIQEGRIGLFIAISTFDKQKNIKFYTYALSCINNKIRALKTSGMTYKHKCLNDALYYQSIDDYDNYFGDLKYEPFSIIKSKEFTKKLIENMGYNLSNFEKEIFYLKVNGLSKKEISEKLNIDIKKISNALCRIRNKVKNSNF